MATPSDLNPMETKKAEDEDDTTSARLLSSSSPSNNTTTTTSSSSHNPFADVFDGQGRFASLRKLVDGSFCDPYLSAAGEEEETLILSQADADASSRSTTTSHTTLIPVTPPRRSIFGKIMEQLTPSGNVDEEEKKVVVGTAARTLPLKSPGGSVQSLIDQWEEGTSSNNSTPIKRETTTSPVHNTQTMDTEEVKMTQDMDTEVVKKTAQDTDTGEPELVEEKLEEKEIIKERSLEIAEPNKPSSSNNKSMWIKIVSIVFFLALLLLALLLLVNTTGVDIESSTMESVKTRVMDWKQSILAQDKKNCTDYSLKNGGAKKDTECAFQDVQNQWQKQQEWVSAQWNKVESQLTMERQECRAFLFQGRTNTGCTLEDAQIHVAQQKQWMIAKLKELNQRMETTPNNNCNNNDNERSDCRHKQQEQVVVQTKWTQRKFQKMDETVKQERVSCRKYLGAGKKKDTGCTLEDAQTQLVQLQQKARRDLQDIQDQLQVERKRCQDTKDTADCTFKSLQKQLVAQKAWVSTKVTGIEKHFKVEDWMHYFQGKDLESSNMMIMMMEEEEDEEDTVVVEPSASREIPVNSETMKMGSTRQNTENVKGEEMVEAEPIQETEIEQEMNDETEAEPQDSTGDDGKESEGVSEPEPAMESDIGVSVTEDTAKDGIEEEDEEVMAVPAEVPSPDDLVQEDRDGPADDMVLEEEEQGTLVAGEMEGELVSDTMDVVEESEENDAVDRAEEPGPGKEDEEEIAAPVEEPSPGDLVQEDGDGSADDIVLEGEEDTPTGEMEDELVSDTMGAVDESEEKDAVEQELQETTQAPLGSDAEEEMDATDDERVEMDASEATGKFQTRFKLEYDEDGNPYLVKTETPLQTVVQ